MGMEGVQCTRRRQTHRFTTSLRAISVPTICGPSISGREQICLVVRESLSRGRHLFSDRYLQRDQASRVPRLRDLHPITDSDGQSLVAGKIMGGMCDTRHPSHMHPAYKRRGDGPSFPEASSRLIMSDFRSPAATTATCPSLDGYRTHLTLGSAVHQASPRVAPFDQRGHQSRTGTTWP